MISCHLRPFHCMHLVTEMAGGFTSLCAFELALLSFSWCCLKRLIAPRCRGKEYSSKPLQSGRGGLALFFVDIFF